MVNFLLSRIQWGEGPLFITGHGRSGTTWIGNVLRMASGVLYVNEPCNPERAKGGNYSDWFKYLQPGEDDIFFQKCLDSAFKGLVTCRTNWLIHKPFRRLFRGYRLVIKEVASYMSVEWVYERYKPDVLVLVRHPCAVALSEKKKGTSVERPMLEIMRQPALLENHLEPYLGVMKKAKRSYEIYGAIWGARNRVLADLIPNYPQWKILFYEDVCKNPLGSFRHLYDHYNLDWSRRVEKFVKRTTVKEKSGTYSISKVSEKQIDKWKHEMTRDEIEQVRKFVEPFNLSIYNSDSDWY